MIILARLLALLVLMGAPATAAASACEGGRYRVDGGIPLAGFEMNLGVVVVASGVVSMSPCGAATKSKVRRGKSRLSVKAVWDNCGAMSNRIKLRMKTDRSCDRAIGRIREKPGSERVKFSAQRGCEFAIDCSPNSLPVDTDGDQCDDSCEDVSSGCVEDVDCWDDYLFCAKATGECGERGSAGHGQSSARRTTSRCVAATARPTRMLAMPHREVSIWTTKERVGPVRRFSALPARSQWIWMGMGATINVAVLVHAVERMLSVP